MTVYQATISRWIIETGTLCTDPATLVPGPDGISGPAYTPLKDKTLELRKVRPLYMPLLNCMFFLLFVFLHLVFFSWEMINEFFGDIYQNTLFH